MDKEKERQVVDFFVKYKFTILDDNKIAAAKKEMLELGITNEDIFTVTGDKIEELIEPVIEQPIVEEPVVND